MRQLSHFTLYELNQMVREAIDDALYDEYWVEAELSEVREVRGHCYMELVEKDRTGNTPIARASAKCWKNTWQLLRPHFEKMTGSTLISGMKVLLKVVPDFHENYGFSWIINDIDPTYTLGDMAKKRREIIAKLQEEGVYDLQKQLRLPLFAQRIAVISSSNAAGYGDFYRHLSENGFGFSFKVDLFPAVMQGEQIEHSVIAALNEINDKAEKYDVVVVIRGGGATSDMAGFDTLALAENIANFPLPVITGIGHDRDESVLDLIAYESVKTPTAAAALLIDNLKRVEERISQLSNAIANVVRSNLQHHKTRLERITQMIKPAIDRRLLTEKHKIDLLLQRAEAAWPQQILERGYSITMRNGRVVAGLTALSEGDKIQIYTSEGIINATVDNVESKITLANQEKNTTKTKVK